jgi:hypothetical protein
MLIASFGRRGQSSGGHGFGSVKLFGRSSGAGRNMIGFVSAFWTFMAMYLRLFLGEEVGKAGHVT